MKVTKSMFSSCDMVKEDDLSIIFTFNFNSFGTITWWVFVWININNFSIPLISEQETGIGVGVNSKVWRIVQCSVLSIPIKETQICRLWQQLLLSFKNLSEVFSFEPMCEINIPRNFILSFSLISDENNGCHSSTSDIVLSVSEGFQKV